MGSNLYIYIYRNVYEMIEIHLKPNFCKKRDARSRTQDPVFGFLP